MTNGKVVSLTDRMKDIDLSKQVHAVQLELHEYFKEANIEPEIAQTALMMYCARLAVQRATPKKLFVAAAKALYGEIAKELRG